VTDGEVVPRSFWPSAPVLVSVGVILGLILWFVLASLAEARDAADASCLASIHASLERSGNFDATRDTASWRRWSRDEVDAAIASLQGRGDCDSSPNAKWRASLEIRSRRAGADAELQLWLRGRPHVSSPWRAEGLPNSDAVEQ
jgi:hypothetical protein